MWELWYLSHMLKYDAHSICLLREFKILSFIVVFIRILNDREQSNWFVVMETFLSDLTPPWLNLAQTMTGRCLLKSPFLPLVWRCRLQWPTYQQEQTSVVTCCVDVCTYMKGVSESTVAYARVLN